MKTNRFIPLLVLPFLLTGCGENSSSVKPSEPSTVTTTDDTASTTTTEESVEPEPGDDTFTMEAEYTNLDDKSGNGYSGGANGIEMIQKDKNGSAKASNGYWVGYLYHTNITLDFVFTSDKAVDNVDLTMRLTCEIKNITLTYENYTITVNDEPLGDYGTITLSGAAASDSSGYVRPFTNHKSKKKISLKEGENKIVFTTANADGMGGTMYATAPMFDCIKLSNLGGANVSYDPITSNLQALEE